jgi:hypothetical protein
MFVFRPSIALAGQGAGDFELSEGNELNSVSTGLTYELTDSQDIDLTQDIRVDDLADTNSRWKGATHGDYNFELGAGALRPFVGANADYVYGNRVNDSLLVRPDAGLKMYVQPKTVIVAQAEYQTYFRIVDQVDESVGSGSVEYSVGFRLHF